ncbi:MAG: hypothetical protein K2K81_04075 [Muribaculaceae bacterium]|nr:hypothetical protein [Muribaculaceae bacterium]
MNDIDSMKIALSDKTAVWQVMGSLIKNPLLFTNKQYSLGVDDFPERFHKILFGAIEHLAAQGLSSISVMDIDQFLVKYDVQYKIFNDNQGMAYVQKCLTMVDPAKFDYYYNLLKKCSLLGELYAQGFDVSSVLDVSLVDPKKKAEQRAAFDCMTLQDIMNAYEAKLIEVQQKFATDKRIVKKKAGDDIMELIDSFSVAPAMGASFTSPKLTTMLLGQPLGTLFIDSSPSGGGKSRRQIAEAAHLSIPHFFDNYKKKWVNTGLNEGVLYISTELKLSEVQGILLGYVSGVGQLEIEGNRESLEERERVRKAAEYIKQANFHVLTTSSLGIDDLIKIIRQYKQLYNVRYVFYDYLSASAKMKASFARMTGTKNVRDDEVILEMCTQLKELANELNIHIHTSSQLNRTWKKETDLDADNLRGAFSMVDLTDATYLTVKTRDIDESVIEAYLAKGFTTRPNMVTTIIKQRKGKYNKCRLYSYFDFATSRMEDCFVTDEDGNFLNVDDTYLDVIIEDQPVEEKKEGVKKFGEFEL